MPYRRHIEVWKSKNPIRVHWLTALVFADLYYGGVNALQHENRAAAQVVLRHAFPTWVWGLALVAASVLLWFGWYVYGAVLGTVCWGALLIATILSIFDGTAQSWAGPGLIGWAMICHMLVTYELYTGLDGPENELKPRG